MFELPKPKSRIPQLLAPAAFRNFRCHDTLVWMLRRTVSLLIVLFVSILGLAATKPNVVLITLDSTRADRIGIFGAKKTATPKLDALATDCLVFEHAYAQSPGTVVSHATIL